MSRFFFILGPILMFFLLSKWIMKFLPAFFKQIQPSDDFCWIIIFFSKIAANGSHCFVHFLYNSGERHRLLRDPLILNVIFFRLYHLLL